MERKIPCPKGKAQVLSLFFRGLFMGVADIVPGISGGTIAFITGIYEDLLLSIKTLDASALKSFFTLKWRLFFQQFAWKFLLVLGGGMAFAIVSVSHLFSWALNQQAYCGYLYGAFFGLVCGSIVFCAKQVKIWNILSLSALLLGIFIAYFLTGAQAHHLYKQATYDVAIPLSKTSEKFLGKTISNIHFERQELLDVPEATLHAMLSKQVIDAETKVFHRGLQKKGKVSDFIVESSQSLLLDPWIFTCGAIAICAMLLPGISGSYLLNILGVYGAVLGAIADFTTALSRGGFEEAAFFLLTSLFLGIIFGAMLFSRLISWVFDTYRCVAISLLTGFMIGALKTVWPFQAYSYFLSPLKIEEDPRLQLLYPVLPDFASSAFWYTLCLALCSFSLVLFLEAFRKRALIIIK